MSFGKGYSALFRLSQNINRVNRRKAIDKARKCIVKKDVKPLDKKMMGFFTEVKSLDYINKCYVCQNPYLSHNFMDYLLGRKEKSWSDIECKKCGEFKVEVKSTKMNNPDRIYGGDYLSYFRTKPAPYLLVYTGLRVNEKGVYYYNGPYLVEPRLYQIYCRMNGQSFIYFNQGGNIGSPEKVGYDLGGE